SGCDPKFGEITKLLAITITNPLNANALADGHRGELDHRLFDQRTLSGGNRRAVRIGQRIPDRRGHSVDELIRRRMLQSLGLAAHAIPPIAERARQIGFEDAVTSNRAERRTSSRAREPNAAISLVCNPSLLGESSNHAAD